MLIEVLDNGVVVASVTSSTVVPPGVADVTAPSVPTGLAATSITDTTYVLTWNASTGTPDYYEVFVDDASAGTTQSLSMTITDATPGTGYSVEIRAVDLAGNASAKSTPITVTTTGS